MMALVWDGKPISKSGLYRGISIDAYHSAMICGDEPSLSSTALRRIWEHSPAKYWSASVFNPRRVDDNPNRGMILGRALHHVAQGQKFTDVFAVQPAELNGEPWHGNRKDCKRWKIRQEEAGLIVVSLNEAVALGGMLDSLSPANCEFVRRGGLNGLIECSMFWRDQETGLWLKARPDAVPTDSGNYTDLKKTTSCLYSDLQWTIAQLSYHMQAALVMAGARDLGLPAESFTLLFVEDDHPYTVRDCTLKDADLDRGTQQNRVAIRQFEHAWTAWRTSKGTYRWPGPHEDIGGYIELPERARERIDHRLQFELGAAA
jgi:hypothetical protein